MDILFLGLMYNPKDEKEHMETTRINLSGAVNKFQWNIIEGIEKNLGNRPVTIYNTLPVGTFPRYYRKIILSSKDWSHSSSNNFEVGSFNLPILKQIMRKKIYIKEIEKWVKNVGGEKQIIAYSLYPVFIQALKRIKMEYPEIKITFIVPDLPSIYGVLPSNSIKSRVYKIYGENILKNLSFIDSFVLLTEQMKIPLKIGKRPFTVVEGSISNILNSPANLVNPTKKVILYTGTLNYKFGIRNLLNAFMRINDPDYELWICGSGEAEREIKECSLRDKRIIYYGYVSNKKAQELQYQTTLLINPRQNSTDYTKYSFPSKTIEYLASGKPVLMYKLDGIPDEYDNFIFYVKGNSIEDLQESIIEVCSKSNEELMRFGYLAREWVLKEKNNYVQTKKIIDMLKNI